MEAGRFRAPAFTIKVTKGLREATIAAAVSTHGLPQVQSGGGSGLGGPFRGSKDLSGYLDVPIEQFQSLF